MTGIPDFAQRWATDDGCPKNSAICCQPFNDSGCLAFAMRPGAAIHPSSYLAAVTDVTEMVSPLAVPVTLACSQASLLSSSSAALSEVSRAQTLSPTTK